MVNCYLRNIVGLFTEGRSYEAVNVWNLFSNLSFSDLSETQIKCEHITTPLKNSDVFPSTPTIKFKFHSMLQI